MRREDGDEERKYEEKSGQRMYLLTYLMEYLLTLNI